MLVRCACLALLLLFRQGVSRGWIDHCQGEYSPSPGLLANRSEAYVEIGTVGWTDDDLREQLVPFYHLYQRRPIANNKWGMRSNHMFFTWFLTRALDPEYVIESGIWKGQSTWLLEQAAPHASVIAIDPHLGSRAYISPMVTYTTTDFNEVDWNALGIDTEKTVCFFDDHYGLDRLFQCYEKGFRYVIWEDNYPLFGGNQHHPSGNAYAPKAAFLANTPESQRLREIIEVYYEFPPIFPNSVAKRFSWRRWKSLSKQPLFTESSNELLALYNREAYTYTWLAFIKLKKNPLLP